MSTLPPLEPHRFDGIAEFEAAVALFLDHAKQGAWQRLLFCDPDFSLWPLGLKKTVAQLDGWSQSGRECVLLAASYHHVQAECPRLVAWRVQWQHTIAAHVAASAQRSKLPRCILSPHACLILLDPDRRRGFISTDAQQVRELQEVTDEILRGAGSGFAPTTLGL